MSLTVCLAANTIGRPVGGHLWVYLNWALGLRALGCRVIWLESMKSSARPLNVRKRVAHLKTRLRPYGLARCVALCSNTGKPLPSSAMEGCLDLDAAVEADLLLDMRYSMSLDVVGRFRRSALLDIDPGLLQIWMDRGGIRVAPHDVYFTIGETVGQPEARFPDCGLQWRYTPPCVALEWWPPRPAGGRSPFTTVSSWWGNEEWVDDGETIYQNDKRTGFLPFLDLPRRTAQPLELCLAMSHEDERLALQERGWRVRDASTVAVTPGEYRRYIQSSRGEFSCAKPSCVRLQNAWISDRTLCYLASGKPAVVQHTGPSRFLPDSAGLFRFRDVREASRCLDAVAADYERQTRLARALAEHYFDAKLVVARLLERAA